MAFCCKCRQPLKVSLPEFLDRNAWCDHCEAVVASSLCKVPCWILAAVTLMSINVMILKLIG